MSNPADFLASSNAEQARALMASLRNTGRRSFATAVRYKHGESLETRNMNGIVIRSFAGGKAQPCPIKESRFAARRSPFRTKKRRSRGSFQNKHYALIRSSKTEDKQTMTRGDRDVLPAVHFIRHWAGGGLASQVGFPQQRARAGVQGLEKPLPTADEKQIRRRRENSAGCHVVHFEGPLLLAGLRIERHHHTVRVSLVPCVDRAALHARHSHRALGRRKLAAHVVLAFLVLDGISGRQRHPVVLPRRHVEQSGARAEGWRIPICRAQQGRVNRGAGRLRS